MFYVVFGVKLLSWTEKCKPSKCSILKCDHTYLRIKDIGILREAGIC